MAWTARDADQEDFRRRPAETATERLRRLGYHEDAARLEAAVGEHRKRRTREMGEGGPMPTRERVWHHGHAYGHFARPWHLYGPRHTDGNEFAALAHFQHEADARLCAAAPELLAACEAAVADVLSTGVCLACTMIPQYHHPNCWVPVMTAAVAKARASDGL